MADPVAPTTLERMVTEGFTRVNGELERVRVELETTKKDVNARLVNLPGVVPGDGTKKDEFSVGRLVRAMATKNWDRAGYEREVVLQTHKRANVGNMTDVGGSALTPVQVAGPFIQKLYASQVVQALGAMILPNLAAAAVHVPAQASSASGAWLTKDSGAPTASRPTFTQRQLSPKKLGGLVYLENSLLRLDSVEPIEALVQNDLAMVLGLMADIAYLFGAGGSGEPLGIYNTPGVDKTTVAIGTNGGDFNVFHAQSLEGVVEDANALVLEGPTGFAFHPKIKRKLKKYLVAQFSGDTGGMPLFMPIMTDAKLTEQLGHQFKTTTQIPIDKAKGSATDCSPVIFGKWRALMVGFWATLEFRVTQDGGDAFPNDLTGIRAIIETDSVVRHTEGFAVCADARVNGA